MTSNKRPLPKEYRGIPKDAKKVFTGRIFDVWQWEQEMFDKSHATFEMLSRPDTVQIIAIIDKKAIILWQKQPNSDWFYDLPSGRVDKGESILDAAKRELLEETGYQFDNWQLIKQHQPYNKIDWLVHTFLATGYKKKKQQQLDSGEKIEVQLLTLDEILKLKDRGNSRFLPFDLLKEALR